MSDKKRFVLLVVLLVLSLALFVYAKLHIGPDFVKQL